MDWNALIRVYIQVPQKSLNTLIKKDFNSVDAVGNGRFVFNIKGNHFRIVVQILFVPKIIYPFYRYS
ncbi:type II toxin-antitoxin system HigB family toxin [Capnocytophaga sputigena]|uniref:type II toxin-antitoxin system HigB family toxin n=1 Tax=Capnocytophaga sputigena TaxID=1019 RepID=UPI0028D324EF|nr:type II toxin-antitoxin system HigB family toxin [Capnocytophaga sputigena]